MFHISTKYIYFSILKVFYISMYPDIKFQVHELSDAFAKTNCACLDDWDYEQDEQIKVSYSLKRRFRIWLMKLKMKFYEIIY